jgi:hypothetical protein
MRHGGLVASLRPGTGLPAWGASTRAVPPAQARETLQEKLRAVQQKAADEVEAVKSETRAALEDAAARVAAAESAAAAAAEEAAMVKEVYGCESVRSA